MRFSRYEYHLGIQMISLANLSRRQVKIAGNSLSYARALSVKEGDVRKAVAKTLDCIDIPRSKPLIWQKCRKFFSGSTDLCAEKVQ